MKHIAIVTAASLALASCTYTSDLEAGKPAAVTAAQAAAIDAGVRAYLKDPSSAEVGRLRAADMDYGGKFVCGYVNARNSFGGYTGPVPFFGTLYDELGAYSFRGVSIGSPSESNFGIRVVCRDRGAPIE